MDLPSGAENALVHQKDALLKMVNEGKLEDAIVALTFVAPFWVVVGYGYKVKEVKDRIKGAVWGRHTEANTKSAADKWFKLYQSVEDTIQYA